MTGAALIAVSLVDVGAGSLDRTVNQIYSACIKGDVATVNELLQKHPDKINAEDEGSKTLLMSSILAGKPEVAKALIRNGADVNLTFSTYGQTPLMCAAEKGYSDIVDLILRHKVDIDQRDDSGDTALMYAIRGGHNTVVGDLIDRGADVTIVDYKNSVTTLIRAVLSYNMETVRLLVAKDRTLLNKADGSDRTPLSYAKGRKGAEIAAFLREQGAE